MDEDVTSKVGKDSSRLVMGVFDIIGGLKGGGIGSLIFGAINVLVGLLLLGSPVAAALAVPLVFGGLLLVQGIALVIWAFRLRACPPVAASLHTPAPSAV